MVRMAHFPKYATVPVSFQCRTAFPWFVADVARRVLDRFAVIEKRAAIGEISVHAWGIRHLPGMDDLSIQIDQVNRAVPLIGVNSVKPARLGRDHMHVAQHPSV